MERLLKSSTIEDLQEFFLFLVSLENRVNLHHTAQIRLLHESLQMKEALCTPLPLVSEKK